MRQTLTIQFEDVTYTYSAELLRVVSPSVEVQGYGFGEQKV